MTEPSSQDEGALADRLAALDSELDWLRRKIWRVEKGLDPVPDRDAELADLRARFDRVSDEFVVSYRAWQTAARRSEQPRSC